MKRILLSAMACILSLIALAEDYNVKIKITNETNDESISTVPIAIIYGEDLKIEGFSMNDEFEYTVPSGEYLFVLQCNKTVPVTYESVGGLIVVPVTVNGADIEVSADLSTVKNRISTVSYLPDGTPTRLHRYDFQSHSNIGGNIEGKIDSFSVIHSRIGRIGGIAGVSNEIGLPLDGMIINDLDENFSIVDVQLLATNDGYLLTGAQKQNGINSDIKLELGKTYGGEYNASFAMSPLGEQCREAADLPYNYVCDMINIDSNNIWVYSSLTFPFSSPVGKVRYDKSLKDLPIKSGVKIGFVDLMENTENGMTLYPIYDLPVILSSGTPEYFAESGISQFRLSDDGYSPLLQAEGHPALSHSAGQRMQIPGDNCPLTVLVPKFIMDWENPDDSYYSYSASGIGRLGELHYGYYTGLQIEGDRVWVEDVVVDGLKGRTEIEVIDCDLDPRVAFMQHLQFRDKNNDAITQKFAKAEDGRILLVGGDYVPNLRENGAITNFSIKEADLKVEYSAYGENDWKEINMQEVPELYFEPGYGYCYEGSLADVEPVSENKWYDLKITTTGKEGNHSVQLVSPAFRIEAAGSGINDITVSEQEEWYNLQGLRVNNPGKGIYIRKTAAGCEKVIRN